MSMKGLYITSQNLEDATSGVNKKFTCRLKRLSD